MGRREYRVKKLSLKRFDLGFFPQKDFDDIPDGGSPNCRHVFNRRSSLRQFPGINRVNSSQASDTSGQGLHYMDVNGIERRLVVFGETLFSESSGTLSDITGTAIIGDGDYVQYIDHQIGSNKYAIGAVGNGNAPFKVGSGNASLLGGSPPNIETVAKYHGTIFGSVNEKNYFSDPEDPEAWDTTNSFFNFEKDILSQIEHGAKLAVLMSDHIGSIQGYDYLDFVKEEKEISNFGCVGKFAAKKCYFGSNDLKVISSIAADGLWIFDEAFETNKILGEDYFDQFNQSALSKSCLAYWRSENLLFVALPYGSSTEPNYLIIVNMRTGAFWPGPDIHENGIRCLASMKDDNGDEFIYFQDNNGYLFQFDMDTNSYHSGTATETIDYYWTSKRYDLEEIHSLGDAVLLAESVGNWEVIMAIKFGLSNDGGDEGSINLAYEADYLGDTFILGVAQLRGSNYVFNVLEGIGGFGRFVQVILSRSNDESESLSVKRIELSLHDHRRGGNDQ